MATHKKASIAGRHAFARKAAASGRPSMPAADALEILRTAQQAMRTLTRDHRAAVAEAEAQVKVDENLSVTGRRARLAELRAEIETRTTAAVDQLAEQISEAKTAMAAHGRARLPKPAGGLEALMARQFAWQRTREMIDGGVDLGEIIEEADPETVHALLDELPSYMRIQGANAETRTAAVRGLEVRLAELTGQNAVDSLSAAYEAETLAAGIEPMLSHLHGAAAGREGDGLAAALASRWAAREVGEQNGVPVNAQTGEPERWDGEDAPEEAPPAPQSLREAVALTLPPAPPRPGPIGAPADPGLIRPPRDAA